MIAFATEDLLSAIRAGDVHAVIAAVRHGADVRHVATTDADGPPAPVVTAVEGGHGAIVRMLLDFGAFWWVGEWNGLARVRELGRRDIETVISARKAAEDRLIAAIRRGDTETAFACLAEDETLATAYEAAHGPGRTMSPLMHAAEVGDAGMVRRLIGLGADPAATCRGSDANAMTVARYGQHREVMRILARHAVDGTAVGDFHWAALNGDLEMVKRMLKQGMDVNARDGSGQHVLRCAAESRNRALISFLLAAGADPARSGHTLLADLVAAADVTDIVEMFLDRGCDPNSRDARGSLLDVARRHGRAATVALLRSRGAS